MRRRISAATAVLLCTVLAACSDRLAPTSSQVATLPGASVRASLSSTPTVDELINALLSGSNRQSALSQWKNIQKDVASGDKGSLLSHVNAITSWVFTHLANGDLRDPDGAGPLTPTTGAVRLLGLIYVYAGLSPTQLPPVPAGWDAGFLLVDPNAAQNQNLVTSFGDAAASVPPGTFSQPVLLVVIRQPDSITVNTPYPRYSRVFDVAIAPEVGFSSFSVLTCPFETIDPVINARAVIAHQKSASEVEYLQPAATGSLTCPHDIGAAWREEHDPLKRAKLQLASYLDRALEFLGPKPLYAGHAAIGGGLISLSPIVVVDPQVGTGITVGIVGTPTYGQSAHVTATLSITSGPAGLVGGAVSGQMLVATVDGGAAQSATTNASGVAGWDLSGLSAGAHSVSVSFAGAVSPLIAPRYAPSSVSTSISVNPATLTITANNAQRVYGDPNPSFTGSVSGQQYGEVVTLSFSTPATVSSPAGGYPIVPVASAAPGVLANYAVTATNGTLTVSPAPLTVQLAGGTYSAGANACAVTYSGFKLGDTPASLTGTLQCTVNGQPAPVPSPMGSYVLVPGGLSSPNYVLTFVGGTVTIRYSTTAGHYFTSPIPNSAYNAGRTIPVKFQLFMADGVTPVATATARVEMSGVNIPDSQSWFVYSAASQAYQLNVNTPRNLAVGTHTITAYLDDGSIIQVQMVIQ